MENEESCINLSTVLSPEPALKTAPVINKGRISFIQKRICFTGTLERNIKRTDIQEIKDVTSFKEKALEWQKYNHEYGAIYENIDWLNLEEAWAHKSRKGSFFKETYVTNQPLRINEIHNKPSSSSTVENVSTSPLSLPRKSNRQLLSYIYFISYYLISYKAVCIVCNEKKYNKGREVEVKNYVYERIEGNCA